MNMRHACFLMVVMVMIGCGDDGEDKSAASKPAAAEDTSHQYDTAERKILMRLARGTLEAVVNETDIPIVEVEKLPPDLKADKGCFVTLTKKGDLRGCIGYIVPNGALYKAVMANAHSAAIRDRRFKPVRTEELKDIEIEISVLTVPRDLSFTSADDLLGKLRPGVDGVVLRAGGGKYSSTYLPQVWKQIPDKTDFMNKLTRKAGLPEWVWKEGNVTIMTYQVEAFSESEL